MAAQVKHKPHRMWEWNGYSHEVKSVTGYPEGATFTYLDTGEGFIFHDGMWEPDLKNEESYRRNVLNVF